MKHEDRRLSWSVSGVADSKGIVDLAHCSTSFLNLHLEDLDTCHLQRCPTVVNGEDELIPTSLTF